MIPEWASKYIGIPFKHQGRDFDGVDCYGLVMLVLGTEFSADIQDYMYEPQPDAETQLEMFERSMNGSVWEHVLEPRRGYVVLLKPQGALLHCGIVLDFTRMLHTTEHNGTCIERFDGTRWDGRVLGFYRHVSIR